MWLSDARRPPLHHENQVGECDERMDCISWSQKWEKKIIFHPQKKQRKERKDNFVSSLILAACFHPVKRCSCLLTLRGSCRCVRVQIKLSSLSLSAHKWVWVLRSFIWGEEEEEEGDDMNTNHDHLMDDHALHSIRYIRYYALMEIVSLSDGITCCGRFS